MELLYTDDLVFLAYMKLLEKILKWKQSLKDKKLGLNLNVRQDLNKLKPRKMAMW